MVHSLFEVCIGRITLGTSCYQQDGLCRSFTLISALGPFGISSALVVPGAGRGPRRRDGGHGGRHELGQVDPVHLARVLRHDVLYHVDPPAEARGADVARDLVRILELKKLFNFPSSFDKSDWLTRAPIEHPTREGRV